MAQNLIRRLARENLGKRKNSPWFSIWRRHRQIPAESHDQQGNVPGKSRRAISIDGSPDALEWLRDPRGLTPAAIVCVVAIALLLYFPLRTALPELMLMSGIVLGVTGSMLWYWLDPLSLLLETEM
ncbi:hypothetical protein WAE61_09190 [Comamonadaceae bacterium PP-2]